MSKRAWDVARQSEPGGVSDSDRSDQRPNPDDVHEPGQIVGQDRLSDHVLIAASFEHCVRTHEDCFRDVDAERLRSLEVNNQIKPGWALDGQVGRFSAAQNPTNVTAATAKHIRKVRPIGDETPCIRMCPVKIYRGETSLLREISDPCSVSIG